MEERANKGVKSVTKTIIAAEKGKQDIVVTREFDAPRELVFKAFTHPELYVQWLGPRDMEMTVNYFEARTGGSYRYSHHDTKGEEFSFHGVYHEVKNPERIVNTFEFEDMPGHVALDSAVFEALPENRTKFTGQTVFQSAADRDGMMASGMRSGLIQSYERLDELLDKLMTEEEARK
jgi:uncharacterized protein YndB with AHSA1/START domain